MILVELFETKCDINGNTYHGCRVTKDGETKVYETDHYSNVESGLREYFGDWEAKRKGCYVTRNTIGIRAMNRLVKGEDYLGCRSEDIAEILREFLGSDSKTLEPAK